VFPDSQTAAPGMQPGMAEDQAFARLKELMKDAAGALNEAGMPFLLGGGLACAARGGPATQHDVDFFLRPENAEAALTALEGIGLRPDRPPEGWLFKAWRDDDFVDLIFSSTVGDVTDEDFARAEQMEVWAVPMLVQRPTDILVMKLLALDELSLRYKGPLEIARALREQIDWGEVRTRTDGSPYAKAFFTLVEELGVLSEKELTPG
jgi:hypothetical protein